MHVNSEVQKNKRSFEKLKWAIVAVLLIIAIIYNYIYRDVIATLRVFVITVIVAIAIYVALLTTKGKLIIIFLQEARNEIRKIIWPTYQETLHTTLIITVVTIIMSLILWGLDSILVRLISFITNLRFF